MESTKAENTLTESEIPSKLEALYSSVPNWEKILECVRRGEQRFINELRELDLDYEVNVSKLHSLKDVEVQAFIVSMSSLDPEEMETKAYFTYAIHWLDDFFDEPELAVKAKEMFEKRKDLKQVLIEMDSVGNIGFKMLEKANSKEGAVKGIQRVLYGGLVQRSLSKEERAMLVAEYVDLSIRFLDKKLASEIRELQPQTFWLTNKVVMEFIDSGEECFDFDVSEVWNLIFAPAIYYHDIDKEEGRGVAGFKDDKPTPEEIVKMIKLGRKYLSKFPDKNAKLRIQQLQLVLISFRNVLPREIMEEYEKIISGSNGKLSSLLS